MMLCAIIFRRVCGVSSTRRKRDPKRKGDVETTEDEQRENDQRSEGGRSWRKMKGRGEEGKRWGALGNTRSIKVYSLVPHSLFLKGEKDLVGSGDSLGSLGLLDDGDLGLGLRNCLAKEEE